MNFFGSKKAQPAEPTLQSMTEEQLREKQNQMMKELQKEMSEIERNMFQIDQAMKKAQDLLQIEIKKGDKSDKFIKQTYAKQVICCQKEKERNDFNKGQIYNIIHAIDIVLANLKMAQIFGIISQIMNRCNWNIGIYKKKDTRKTGIVIVEFDEAMENMKDYIDLEDIQQQADDLIYQIESQQEGSNKQLPQKEKIQQQQESNQDLEDFEKNLQQL